MMEGLLDTVRDWPIKQKLAAVIGLIVVVFVLDYSYIYSPRSEALTQMKQDLGQQQATLEEKRLKVNARADEEKRIRDLQADVKRGSPRGARSRTCSRTSPRARVRSGSTSRSSVRSRSNTRSSTPTCRCRWRCGARITSSRRSSTA